MMKSVKILALTTVLTLGSLSAASASERQYDASMPRQAVQQHEQYVKSLERAAARDAKRAKAQVASATPTDGNAVAITGAITTIIIIAALL
jgi:erythromycin esterase-like protein